MALGLDTGPGVSAGRLRESAFCPDWERARRALATVAASA